ncbi:MAG: hypothetical protein ACF8XB_25270 [Planctomycetota bacterium JB042]
MDASVPKPVRFFVPRLAAPLAGLGLASLAVWIAFGGGADRPATEDAPRATAVRDAASPSTAGPVPAGAPAPRREEEVVVVAAPPPAVAAETPAPRGVGRLRFAVVDASTGASVEGVAAAFGSDDRFHACRLGGESRFEGTLTAAEYALGLRAPGYEDLLVPALAVRAGGETDGGVFAMVAGSAVLTVRIEVPPGVDREGIFVELRGNVRPGWEGEPASEWAPLRPGGRRAGPMPDGTFRFAELPAGRYAFRPTGTGAADLTPARVVDLARGDRRDVVVEIGRVVEQVVELRDVGGAPLVIGVPLDREGGDVPCFRPGGPFLSFHVGRSEDSRSFAHGEWAPFRLGRMGCGSDGGVRVKDVDPLQPLDRERRRGDRLFAPPAEPVPTSASLEVTRTGVATFSLRPVPIGRFEVRVYSNGDIEGRGSATFSAPSGPVAVVLAPERRRRR